MKVKVTAPEKTLKIMLVVTLLLFLFFAGLPLYEYINTTTYQPVKATIDGVEKETTYTNYSSSGRSFGATDFIRYHFELDGNTYAGKSGTLLPLLYKNRKTVTIYHSVTDPNVIRDRYLIEIGVCGMIFVCVFMTFIIWCLHTKKKERVDFYAK